MLKKTFFRNVLCVAALSLAATLALAESNPVAGLEQILSLQSDENKERFKYRNPQETLNFFDIEPQMSVMEVLPGGGWYSKILIPYLGGNGKLVGIDYPLALWPNLPFGTEEFIEKRQSWVETWVVDAKEWGSDNGASVSAVRFSEVPETLNGSVDAVLYIRALHNLARFEKDHGFLTIALSDTFRALKPGGIVGIVQHRAREDRNDDWADGSSGYLKQSYVVAQMEKAGFVFDGQSDINANEKDQAGEGDIVWRLPPSLSGADKDSELKAKMIEVGESNRMTLKFHKPSE